MVKTRAKTDLGAHVPVKKTDETISQEAYSKPVPTIYQEFQLVEGGKSLSKKKGDTDSDCLPPQGNFLFPKIQFNLWTAICLRGRFVNKKKRQGGRTRGRENGSFPSGKGGILGGGAGFVSFRVPQKNFGKISRSLNVPIQGVILILRRGKNLWGGDL